MSGITERLKGHGQESPLDFLAILKVLYVKQKKFVQSVEKPRYEFKPGSRYDIQH